MREDVAKVPIANRLVLAAKEVDLIGLLLFTAGWTCLLLPLTLAKLVLISAGYAYSLHNLPFYSGGTLPWSSYKIIVLLVFGPLILIAFAFYEAKVAQYPIIPARFLRNRTVLAASLIGFFDFISFYLQFTYQYSFICGCRCGVSKD